MKISQYAIDNDMHPSAIERLGNCNLDCLDDHIKMTIGLN